jgi:hypothetical protein
VARLGVPRLRHNREQYVRMADCWRIKQTVLSRQRIDRIVVETKVQTAV